MPNNYMLQTPTTTLPRTNTNTNNTTNATTHTHNTTRYTHTHIDTHNHSLPREPTHRPQTPIFKRNQRQPPVCIVLRKHTHIDTLPYAIYYRTLVAYRVCGAYITDRMLCDRINNERQ